MPEDMPTKSFLIARKEVHHSIHYSTQDTHILHLVSSCALPVTQCKLNVYARYIMANNEVLLHDNWDIIQVLQLTKQH